mmetsp:Transcript_137529/g.343143  ORF Transcript_137529/g.343143 Transcript_137529/m.343143 type:complete len:527 (-) Transcript_137529:79-1659(-)
MALAHRDIAGLLRKHGYVEKKKIGEGSFGKAILVDGEDGAKLVCKMVDVSQASRREIDDAVKEGKLLAAFKHPYIVRYRESFIESGWLCILMDYCEGGDLTRQIETSKRRGQRIPEEQILRWMTQALLALKYIHERHVLHRDLKSGNFFLSKSGNLKMGDFGIAKVLSCTAACAKTQIGTPYYLSPEVCSEKPYTWPSDIWAMGCILYELCALKVPFDAPNISGLVQKICRGPTPSIPAGYSDFMSQLCRDMLNRIPTSRPSAENILQRPQIQAIVKQMLEQAQAAHADNGSASASAESLPNSVAPSAPPSGAGSCAERASVYRKGDLVEYYSNTHKDWLPATVVNVDDAGRIIVDLKPNTWITRDQQASAVRPRSKLNAEPAHCPAPALAPPMAPPMRQRSPSAGHLPSRAPSPGRALYEPMHGGGAVGSRCGTPSRVGPQRRSREPSPAGIGSRANTPSRGSTPTGCRAQSPRGGRGLLPGGPPGMPRAPMPGPIDRHSPPPGGLARPCRAANAAGMAIAGGPS